MTFLLHPSLHTTPSPPASLHSLHHHSLHHHSIRNTLFSQPTLFPIHSHYNPTRFLPNFSHSFSYTHHLLFFNPSPLLLSHTYHPPVEHQHMLNEQDRYALVHSDNASLGRWITNLNVRIVKHNKSELSTFASLHDKSIYGSCSFRRFHAFSHFLELS